MSVVLSAQEAREILEYIETMERACDGEWGFGRKIPALIEENELPDMYYVLKER